MKFQMDIKSGVFYILIAAIAFCKKVEQKVESARKKHLLVHTHHPHHYMIDPLPIHYHHHRRHGGHAFEGYVTLGDNGQNLLGEGYEVLPHHNIHLPTGEHTALVGNDEDEIGGIGPFRSNLAALHMLPHGHFGHHRPSFDELFPVEDENVVPHFGPLVGHDTESDTALTDLANHLDATHDYSLNLRFPDHHHHHRHYHHHSLYGFGANGLDEEYGEGLLTPVDHDDPTGEIVADMTQGNDIDHIYSGDAAHVHIKDHDGRELGGWVASPYIYGVHRKNGWGDGYHANNLEGFGFGYAHGYDQDHLTLHSGNHWKPVSHVIDHHHLLQPDFHEDHYEDFRFHYPTYEIPVHGNIVSEKEAKRIGLFDEQYLKRLGIWEETRGNGQSAGGNNWIGGMGGHLDKLAYQRNMVNGTNTTINVLNPANTDGGVNFEGVDGGCRVPADIGFLFDGTNKGTKKREYFAKYIEFAKQVVQYHQPSPDGYHYGAVVYTDKGELAFDFDKSYDAMEIIAEFDRIKTSYPKLIETLPFMGDGLKISKEQLFDSTAREWVYQVLIILTDTKSKDEDLDKWAQALRDSTVNIYVIGFSHDDTKADKDQMELAATDLDKHHVFNVDIDKLLGTEDQVDHPQYLAKVIPNHVCRLDIVFVVDMSKNDGERLTAIKDFIKESTADFRLGQWGSHIAVVGYGGKASREGWDLMSKWDRQEFMKAVDRLEEETGASADAGKALDTTLKYYLEEKNEPREGMFWRYINVTIIITDNSLGGDYGGASKKLRDHGVIIHGIGWDKANEDAGKKTLEDASSDSDEFFVHVHKEITKLRLVAKRMKHYFAHLMMGRQNSYRKIEGGWEGHYSSIKDGNDMFPGGSDDNGYSKSSRNLYTYTSSSFKSNRSSSSSSSSSQLSLQPGGVRSLLLKDDLDSIDKKAPILVNGRTLLNVTLLNLTNADENLNDAKTTLNSEKDKRGNSVTVPAPKTNEINAITRSSTPIANNYNPGRKKNIKKYFVKHKISEKGIARRKFTNISEYEDNEENKGK